MNTDFWVLFGVYYRDNPSSIFSMMMLASSRILSLLSSPTCVKPNQCLLTLKRLMSYIYGAPILDVSRSHTTTQHSR
jgi:hypothetical protein